MRELAVFVAVMASIIGLFAAGCGATPAESGTSPERSPADIKAELQGRSFASETEFLMPRVVQGELKSVYEHYYLTFQAEDVLWTQDDMCAQQPYWIDGAGNIALSEDTLSAAKAIGHYDSESDRVEWNGLWYAPR